MKKKKLIIYAVFGVITGLIITVIILFITAYKTLQRAEINLRGIMIIEMSLEVYLEDHHNEWPSDWSFLNPDNDNDLPWNNDYIRNKYKLRGINLFDDSPNVIIPPRPIFECDDKIEIIEKMYYEALGPETR